MKLLNRSLSPEGRRLPEFARELEGRDLPQTGPARGLRRRVGSMLYDYPRCGELEFLRRILKNHSSSEKE